MKKCKHKLQILSSTWSKESNELFDYESPDLFKQEIFIETSGNISRNKNQIQFFERNLNDSISPITNESLFNIDCTTNQFFINTSIYSSSNESRPKESTWITLRHFQTNKKTGGYSLSVGDLVRLGRVAMKIREIQIDGKSKGNIFDIYKECTKPNLLQNTSKNVHKKKVCRVCYCDDVEVESPLINPCRCSGGLKYIHLSCLQHWLKSKSILVTTSNENCTVFTFNQIECELCKQIFPDFVKVDNTYYQIFDFSGIKYKNYISFETLPFNAKKSVYVVSFDKKSIIKIGRSHESDLRITDVTVSRFHAQITRTTDQAFLLTDTTSKFGSLIYLHLRKIPIFNGLMLPLQIGRSFFQIIMKINRSICNCFGFFPIKKRINGDYCELNSKEIIIDKMLSVKIQLIDDNDEEEEGSNPDEILEEKKTNKKEIKDMLNQFGADRQVEEMNTLNYVSGENHNGVSAERNRNMSLINLGLYSNNRSSGMNNNNNTNITIE